MKKLTLSVLLCVFALALISCQQKYAEPARIINRSIEMLDEIKGGAFTCKIVWDSGEEAVQSITQFSREGEKLNFDMTWLEDGKDDATDFNYKDDKLYLVIGSEAQEISADFLGEQPLTSITQLFGIRMFNTDMEELNPKYIESVEVSKEDNCDVYTIALTQDYYAQKYDTSYAPSGVPVRTYYINEDQMLTRCEFTIERPDEANITDVVTIEQAQ